MKLSPELEEKLKGVSVGSSGYHYIMADELARLSNEELDMQEKVALLERSNFHRNIGDGFSGK